MDAGLLEETLSGLEEFTLFDVGPAPDHVALISYARSTHRSVAEHIVLALKRRDTSTARDLICSTTNADADRDDIHLDAVRWMWRYTLSSGDALAFEQMTNAPYPTLREFLDEMIAFERRYQEFGWLYLMLEEGTDPSICKIGRTNNNPDVREKQLNASTSQHRRILLKECWKVTDSSIAERLVHRELARHRVNAGREFFEIEPRRAALIIDDLLTQYSLLL